MVWEIESFIEQFNKGWTEGEFDRITPLLHNHVIFISPDLKTEIKGRDACIGSIKEYVNNATTKIFKVTDKKIHIWDETALVDLDYYVEYEMKGHYYKENGKEFWTLSNQNGRWELVWRAIVMNEKID